MKTLGELIKLAREAKEESGKPWSQDRLAEAVGISKQHISGIERDKKKPSLSLLVSIHEQLLGTDEPEAQVTLGVWLLAWLERYLLKEDLQPHSRAAIELALNKAIDHFIQPVDSPNRTSRRSLRDFPYPSEPLTIVCGDRRDLNPKTRGDIFADSVSITDLTFLLRLGLTDDVTIKSDKLFVLMGREYLEKEFGKTNLLVIGSPAVNFVARVINNHSVFRFNLPPWLKQKEEVIRTLKEPEDWDSNLPSLKELNELKNLDPFWQLAKNREDTELLVSDTELSEETAQMQKELVKRLLDKANPSTVDIDHVKQLARMSKRILGEKTAKAWMNDFRMPGLIDFADFTLHATSTRGDNDFALISLAPNPFASCSDYVCVFVAGIHGPGTAHALRALAEDDFEEHPFGGIIEVEIDQFNMLWPARFQQATWRWQTKPYSTGKLLANLERVLDLKDNRPREFETLTDDEIKECLEFVRAITERSEGY